MYVCMYACMYACIYVCIYIYTNIHYHIYPLNPTWVWVGVGVHIYIIRLAHMMSAEQLRDDGGFGTGVRV